MFCDFCLSFLVMHSYCSKLFWPLQSRFPHDVALMHHMQIRNLRVPHSSLLCLLTDV